MFVQTDEQASRCSTGIALWAQWTLSTTVAGAISWFVAGLSISFSLGFASVAAGAIVGFSIGRAQSAFVQRCFHVTKSWTFYSAVGGSVAGFFTIAMVVFPQVVLHLTARSALLFWQVFPFFILLTGGVLFSLLQTRTLRRQHRSAIWWIVANAFSWIAGGLSGVGVGTLLYERLIPDDLKGGRLIGLAEGLWVFTAGVAGTATYSAITGLAIVWILQKQ